MKTAKRKPITLGCLARDTITGYSGTVIALTEWLNGCRRVTIQAREMKDGKPIDSYCIDIEQAELIEPSMASKPKPAGGPMPSVSRQAAPAR